MYGCLVEGLASCEGYSRAFQYILSSLNIDNRLVTGEASDDGITYIGHMWNFVVIDGKGYFVDVTWDDPGSENSVLHHTYFNVTTEQILLRHTNIKQPIPLCTDTESNFFYKEGAMLTRSNSDALKDSLETIILTSKFKGYNCAEIKFDSAHTLSWAIDEFFNKGVVYRSYQITGLLNNEPNAQVYYSVNEELYTICMYF
jgi:transglutaminase/protease-like cytokinesis protein 3